MTKYEKKLFKALCSFKNKDLDHQLLEHATPEVLGQLFYNRMQAVAYGVLKENGVLGKVNREFRNSLKIAYEYNQKKNESFFLCLKYLFELLEKSKCRYAMLKGAYLCGAYPTAYRTSNDIDLLVSPSDITKIGNILLGAGFKQGKAVGDVFVPASRQEIIRSRMMYGETVPYVKEVNLPGMRFLEIDINFSLDYKPGDTREVEKMLNNTVLCEVNGITIRTLCRNDFFVHLCTHLYKEATTLPWVEMKRDMTLYKYADIYMLLNDMSNLEVDNLFEDVKAGESELVCSYAIFQMSKLFLFENMYAFNRAKRALSKNPDFINTVFSPRDGKRYLFKNKSIEGRFFSVNRKQLLKEIY